MLPSSDCQFALHEHLAALIRSWMSSRGLEIPRGQRVFEDNLSWAGTATKWHAPFKERLIRTIGPSRIGGNPVQQRKTATHRISAPALEPLPRFRSLQRSRRTGGENTAKSRDTSGRAPDPCWGPGDGPEEKTDRLVARVGDASDGTVQGPGPMHRRWGSTCTVPAAASVGPDPAPDRPEPSSPRGHQRVVHRRPL